MSENTLVKQFIGQDPKSLYTYSIYRQAADVYRRAKSVMANTPKYQLKIANAKNVEVKNVTTQSSKIFACK